MVAGGGDGTPAIILLRERVLWPCLRALKLSTCPLVASLANAAQALIVEVLMLSHHR